MERRRAAVRAGGVAACAACLAACSPAAAPHPSPAPPATTAGDPLRAEAGRRFLEVTRDSNAKLAVLQQRVQTTTAKPEEQAGWHDFALVIADDRARLALIAYPASMRHDVADLLSSLQALGAASEAASAAPDPDAPDVQARLGRAGDTARAASDRVQADLFG